MELGRRSIYHATHRDGASGGVVRVYHAGTPTAKFGPIYSKSRNDDTKSKHSNMTNVGDR